MHVGQDLARLALQGRGQRDCRGVRTTAPQSRHFPRLWIHSLKTGDDHDLVPVEGVPDSLSRYPRDPCLTMGRVGEDPCLGARVADGVDTPVVKRHRQQRHRDPLAGG